MFLEKFKIYFFAYENIKNTPQKVEYFSRISLTAKPPKIKNSQMWLIEQLYIELGLTDFFSFEFVGYYLSSYDEAKIGSKLLTGSWRQKIDSGPGMNEPTNLLLQIQVGFPCSEKLFYPLTRSLLY